MSKQINKFTAVALGAAGAGAALALTNKHTQENAKRENLRVGVGRSRPYFVGSI